MKIFIGIFLLFFFQYSIAQKLSKIDSLQKQLNSSEESAQKVNTYLDIAAHYLVSQIDSCPFYAQQGLSLARKTNYKIGIIQSLNTLGNYHERKGHYEEAIKLYNESLNLSKKENYKKGMAMALNNIAIIHTRKGNYTQALELYFETLELEESEGNKKGIAETYNNIGVIYYYQQNISKTLEYLEKSIAIEEALGSIDVLKKGYNNLGALYDYQKQYVHALSYYHKAYQLSKKIDDKKEIAMNLNNIAVAHHHLQNLDSAFWYLDASIEIRQKLGDYYGVAYSYHNFGTLHFGKGDFKMSEFFFNKSLELSQRKNLKEIQSQSYKSLATLYSSLNKHKKANEFLLLYNNVKDSLINEQNTKAIAEMESKYETAKKEKDLLEKQRQIDQQNITLKQKNIQLLSISALSIILFLVFLLIFNYQYQRNKQLEKENQLKEAMAKIAIQENLQEQRLRISRELHDNIGSQLTFIISSIDNLKYGSRFEDNKWTDKLKNISEFTSNTILELRDTIWAMNKAAISFEDLKLRIQNFLSKAKNNIENIDFQFNINDISPNETLSSLEGINVYRIIQEATNNALKYAQATKITISISKNQNTILLKIEDNGIGFDKNKTSEGFGLQNMQKRAKEINAQITIDSIVQNGTSIALELHKTV